MENPQRSSNPWESHRKNTRATRVGVLGTALFNHEARSNTKEAYASTAGMVWEPQRARKQESGCCLSFVARLAVCCNNPADLRNRRIAHSTLLNRRGAPGATAKQEPTHVNGESPKVAMVVQEAESPAQYDPKATSTDGAISGDDELESSLKKAIIPDNDVGVVAHPTHMSNPGATAEQELTQVNAESPAVEMIVQEETQLNGESPAQCDLKKMSKDGAIPGDDESESALKKSITSDNDDNAVAQSTHMSDPGATAEQEPTQVNGESPAVEMAVQEATKLNGESPAQNDQKAMSKDGAISGGDEL